MQIQDNSYTFLSEPNTTLYKPLRPLDSLSKSVILPTAYFGNELPARKKFLDTISVGTSRSTCQATKVVCSHSIK